MDEQLGKLGVDVRATAEQFSADMRKVQTSATNTTDAIVKGWGKSASAAVDAVATMERKTANKAILKDFDSTTSGIVKGWTKAGEAAKDAGVKTERSFDQAGSALKSLEQMIGVNLPNAAGKFLEKSATIGPILTGAFSAIAVVGIIQALGQLPPLFDKLVGAITGFDDAAKKAYANFLSDNKKAVEAAETFRLKLIEIQEGSAASLTAAIQNQDKILQQSLRAAIAIQERINEQQRAGTSRPGFQPVTSADLAALETLKQQAAEAAEKIRKLRTEQELGAAKDAADIQKKAADKALSIREDMLRRDKAMQLAEQQAIFEDIAERESKRFEADRRMQQMEQDAIFQDQADAAARLHKMWVDDQKAMQQEITEAVMFGVEERERILEADRRMQKAEQDAIFDDMMDAEKRRSDAAKKSYEDTFNSIKRTASQAFLDIFREGESVFTNLAGVIKGLFRTLASEILSTMTAQLLTPLVQKVAASMGGLLSKIPGLGGIFGGAASAGGLGGGAGAGGAAAGGGIGISGAAIGAFATNPITIAVAGAIAAGIAWTKSQAHHEANTFVQKFQNPFGKMLGDIVDTFNEAASAGALTKEEGAAALESVHELWDTFTAQAKEFAKGGSDEALVVKQAFQQLDPLLKQIFSDMEGSIVNMTANAQALEAATEAAKLIAEDMARTQGFIDRVQRAADGAKNLAEALGFLEGTSTPTAIILDRLGSDIEAFFNILTKSGMAIPDMIQKYHDLATAQESVAAATERIRNTIPAQFPGGPFSQITASSAEEVRAFLAALGINASTGGDVYLDGNKVGVILRNSLYSQSTNLAVKVTGIR